MALVRCPKHKIPYNDSNPRGCPACAREKEGGAEIMQELARASQMIKRPTSGSMAAPPPPPPEVDAPVPAAPVTAQPRIPIPVVTRLTHLLILFRNRRTLAVGGALAVLLLVALILRSGPRFTDAPSPAVYGGTVRPFPVTPNDPITVVFAAVGPQQSQPNPTSGSLERYWYGTDLFVDAHNGLVYAMTMAVPNRHWRGLRVGMNRTNTEGMLALLGPPREAESPTAGRPDTVAGYVVYRSLDSRPRRTLLAEVRPPNGCFDVLVDLQPRAIGTLSRGQEKWVVITRVNGVQEDVVTRIRVVSRAIAGPYSGEPVC
ncbi:MAG: hypothetical protein HY700_05700 [Gemmatimonadetes bacterium]|nr:hypothetical protein [Gemmatimonadota bacterium]